MAQNPPRDERWLQREIADLKRRLAALETAPRAGNTSFAGGVLTVGDPNGDDKIRLDASQANITFTHGGNPAGRLRGLSGVGGGAALEGDADTGDVLPFPTAATASVSGVDVSMSASASDPVSGDHTSIGNVSVSFVYDGTDHAPQISLTASSQTLPDSASILLDANGGVYIASNRSGDPPAPPVGTVLLYVKGSPSRLYYRDPGGTVRGPL